MQQSKRQNWAASLLAGLGMIMFAALPAVAGGTAGELDAAFGTGGVATTDESGAVTAVAVQSNGKTVVAGSDPTSNGGRTWLLRRYSATGALDTSFGVNGEARPFGTATTSAGLEHMTIDSSGRVVATGMGSVEIEVTKGKGKKQTTEIQTVVGFVTIRLDTSGDLDTTFGDGGVVALDVADLEAPRGRGVAIAGDGRIVVSGYGIRKSKGRRGSSTSNVHVFVTRLEIDGSLDTGFGTDGFTTNDLGESHPGGIGLQSDGGIVVGSYDVDSSTVGSESWALTRYDANGSVDSNFGTRLGPDYTFVLNGFEIDASDRIVVTGLAASADLAHVDRVLVRYGSGGTLDSGFGLSGVTRLAYRDRNTTGIIALQADGKILLGGNVVLEDSSGSPLSLTGYLARFDTHGDLDATFGTGGIADMDLSVGIWQVARAMTVAPDGSILVAGECITVADTSASFLARFCD